MERRVLRYEIRTAKKFGRDGHVLSGYAARYNTLSHDLGGFRERIAKRAFDKVLATKPDCVALLNHDNNMPLGRTTASTLKLEGDDQGLRFVLDLPNTSYANDLYESVQRGDMNGCSFQFSLDNAQDEVWDDEDDPDTRGKKSLVRTIKNFRGLHDISIVTNPAYPGTSVDARSLEIVGAEVRSTLQARRFEETRSFLNDFRRRAGLPSAEEFFASQRQRQANEDSARARRRNLLNTIL